MKQIFTLVLIVFVISANAQFSAGMHVGGSNKNLITGFHTQYIFQNRFTVGLNMTAHASKIDPAFIQSRFGLTLGETEQKGVTMQPYIGYSYGIQNFEQKKYGGHITGGFQMRFQFSEIATVYADVNFPAPKYTMFSIGIAGIIPHECIK
jgi:hypothetical protein